MRINIRGSLLEVARIVSNRRGSDMSIIGNKFDFKLDDDELYNARVIIRKGGMS